MSARWSAPSSQPVIPTTIVAGGPEAGGPEQDDGTRPVTDPERDLRTYMPHPARVYDYWLGGKDNFEADRVSARAALEQVPEFLDYAAGNRKFLVRATR